MGCLSDDTKDKLPTPALNQLVPAFFQPWKTDLLVHTGEFPC